MEISVRMHTCANKQVLQFHFVRGSSCLGLLLSFNPIIFTVIIFDKLLLNFLNAGGRKYLWVCGSVCVWEFVFLCRCVRVT